MRIEKTSDEYSPFTGTPQQVADCVAVREACESVAKILYAHCPENSERITAISSLRYAVQQAIGCIVLNHR